MKLHLKNLAITFFSLATIALGQVIVEVDPYSTLAIEGESELKRERYFALSDHGVDFDKRVSSEQYNYLVNDLNIKFGRNLGPVRSYAKFAIEDSARSGHADLEHLKKKLAIHYRSPSGQLMRDFEPSMDIAAHGQIKAYPEFMGLQSTEYLDKHPSKNKHGSPTIPANTRASAELAANVLNHVYDDLTRPKYFEPINEPHWSYLTDPSHIATWHLDMHDAVKKLTPEVLVGGPCVSIGYFANQNYQPFKGLQKFIDATEGKLDFYSFHVYDYYRWENEQFGGAILGGLPLEGSLDLVANYTHQTLGKAYPIVVSEHGGYATSSEGDNSYVVAEQIASKLFPGAGFEWRMKARSIHEFVHVDSAIRNTLSFMDHPHTLVKAVPFFLLESSRWDPLYYACLFVKKDFDPKADEYVPSTLLNFYELFRDLSGHRVLSPCSDPDIQVRSFRNKEKLFVVAHNLADKDETLSLEFPQPHSANLRRFGKNADQTPFLRENQIRDFSNISLNGRETVVLIATYETEPKQQRSLNQTIHYGNKTIVPATKGKPAIFQINVPNKDQIKAATLRIGLNRAANSEKKITLTLNGTLLSVPLENSADRITTEKHGYSTTKIVQVEPKLIQERNEITISFPDEKSGTIGSAVFRVLREQ